MAWRLPDSSTSKEIFFHFVSGKCSECVRLNMKSTVRMSAGGVVTGVVPARGHYDEDGNWIPPSPDRYRNTLTTTGQCSNGHTLCHVERVP